MSQLHTLIPEQTNLNFESTYNYITTNSMKLKEDLQVKEEEIDSVSKVGKFSIYNATICDISNYDQFTYIHQKLLFEIREIYSKYEAKIKTKSAIIHVDDRVVNKISYKISVNNKKKEIWIEPHLTYE